MGKLSNEDKATLDRLQQQRDAPDDDDDDDYIWVRLENGNAVRLHGQRARAWCRKHGIDIDEAEDSTQAAPVEAAGQPAKKTAAKKAVPAAKGTGVPEAGDVEAGEELDQDPPARGRPRQFF